MKRKLALALYYRRKIFKEISLLIAISIITLFSLISCSGITKPCVSCNREVSSDPFDRAEEVKFEDLGTPAEQKEREKKKSNSKTDL